MSVLPAALVDAYRATDYVVHGDPGFVLRIDQRSAALAAHLARCNAASAAFITAWNPEGVDQAPAVNRAAEARLRAWLIAGGWPTLAGRGEWPADPALGEDSVLAIGLGADQARAIGTQCRQNAIVWCGTDAIPRLVVLR